MKFGLLGTLSVWDEDAHAVPSAPKQRQLLALLLLNANRVVPVADCIEELWGHTPPNTAVSTLQTYVMQLPKGLGSSRRIDSKSVRNMLVTKDRGYLFTVEPGELDLEVARALGQDGQGALERDDIEDAARLFRDALNLWRGPALVDVQIGPTLRTHLTGIEEFRLTCLEQRIEADLRLGRHHELLSELRQLVGQHPHHESLHAQLMVALYRSGRPAQSLETYHGIRRSLNEELGLEPSPRLRKLQQAVLASDPVLDVNAHARSRLSLDITQRPRLCAFRLGDDHLHTTA